MRPNDGAGAQTCDCKRDGCGFALAQSKMRNGVSGLVSQRKAAKNNETLPLL